MQPYAVAIYSVTYCTKTSIKCVLCRLQELHVCTWLHARHVTQHPHGDALLVGLQALQMLCAPYDHPQQLSVATLLAPQCVLLHWFINPTRMQERVCTCCEFAGCGRRRSQHLHHQHSGSTGYWLTERLDTLCTHCLTFIKLLYLCNM